MKAIARSVDKESLPRRPDGTFQIPMGQVFLTPKQEYEVHSIVLFEERLKFLVLDDSSWPKWYPTAFFDVIEETIPPDWICNVFHHDQLTMVIGPRFIAKDIPSYDAMVNLDSEAVRSFWARLDWLLELELSNFFERVKNEIPTKLYDGIQELMELGETAEALEIVCWELMESGRLELESWRECVELSKALKLNEANTINWNFWKKLVKYKEKFEDEQ